MQVIIYNDAHVGLCIFPPAEWALAEKTMAEIAAIAVPTGRRYAIIDSSDLPEDWAIRDAWFVDDADLTDGVGGDEGVPAHGLFKPNEEETA